MKTLLILIFGIIIGYVIAKSWGNKNRENEMGGKEMKKEDEKEGIDGINQKRTEEKNERKERVLEYLREKGKANNDEIQALLGVSDSSATNYLNELEKEGKIHQIGDTGSGVYYELVK